MKYVRSFLFGSVMFVAALMFALRAFAFTPVESFVDPASGNTVALPPAPYLPEEQRVYLSETGVRAKAAPVSFNPASKFEVANAFKSIMQAADPPIGWTGSIAGCNPGDTAQAYKDAVERTINFYRALAGLPGNVTFSAANNAMDQAAALIMSANNTLTHAPTAGMACYSQTGATGAGSSNLSLGAAGPSAIDLYMDDPGGGNESVGHRRWILFPPQGQMGTGDIAGAGASAANALRVFGPYTTRPATPNGTAYPTAGYFPYQLLPASTRWSFHYPQANFANATVSVTGVGVTYTTTVIARDTDRFGDAAIVWTTNVPRAVPSQDITYTVNVNNVLVGGQARNFSYNVIVFDPASVASCDATKDSDGDGMNDCVEAAEGRNPLVKDNDVIGNNRLFVMQMYRDLFYREGTAAEITAAVNGLAAGTTRAAFAEQLMSAPEHEDLVGPQVRLYFAYFLRLPDPTGLNFWVTQYRTRAVSGWTFDGISEFFSQSTEFQQRYGALNNDQFVTLIYNNVLTRAPEPSGFAFWTSELNSGRRIRGNVMAAFSESPENKALKASDVRVVASYFGLLRTIPDQASFNSWTAQLKAGSSSQSLINQLLANPAYRARFLP